MSRQKFLFLVHFSSFDVHIGQSQLHQSLIKYAKSHLQGVIKPSAHPSPRLRVAHVFYKRKLAEEFFNAAPRIQTTPVGRDKVRHRYSLLLPAPKLTRQPRFIIYARGTSRPADRLLAGVHLARTGERF